MRKTLTAVLGLIAALSLPATATQVGLFASFYETDEFSDTFGFGFRTQKELVDTVFGDIRATYYRDLTRKVDGGRGDLPRLPFDVEDIVIEAGLSWAFFATPTLHAYIGGGGSYHVLSADGTADNNPRLDNEFGWYVQLGGEATLGDAWGIFAEVLYRDVTVTLNPRNAIHGREELDLSGFAVNIGLSRRW